jgi:hypothetical protein
VSELHAENFPVAAPASRLSALAVAFKAALRQRAFVVAAVVLLAAAIGLNGAVAQFQLYFRKLPVPLRHDLTSLPARMGSWAQVSLDEPLAKDMQDVLATDLYIFRDYINLDVFTDPAVLSQFDNKTTAERKALLVKLQAAHPEAVINMAITYYTGKVDTVAHVPDRCYVADGYEPSTYDELKWDLGSGRLGKTADEDPRVPVRVINFEDQTGFEKAPRTVVYFFHVNGHYESDSQVVRWRLQNLQQRYGYYAKIELMMVPRDRAESARVIQSFLVGAMPEIERLLPDWNRVISTAK